MKLPKQPIALRQYRGKLREISMVPETRDVSDTSGKGRNSGGTHTYHTYIRNSLEERISVTARCVDSFQLNDRTSVSPDRKLESHGTGQEREPYRKELAYVHEKFA